MSESKFDDKIRETLEGHEPEVNPRWDKMKDRLAAAAAIGAIGVDAAGSKIATQLSIGAAVVIGAVTLWVAQQIILPEDEVIETTLLEEVVDLLGVDILSDDETEFNETEALEIIEAETSASEANSPNVPSKPVTTSEQPSVDVSEAVSGIETPVADLEELPISASVKTSCVGAQVEFAVEGSDVSKSYLWNFGDGSFSSDANPLHTYDMPGVFDVTLSVRSPGESIKTRTIENLIAINPQPKAVMSWRFPRIITGNTLQAEFVDKTTDTNSATWIVDGEVSSSKPILKIPGKYNVNLIASNQFGCQDHVSRAVLVGDRHLLNAPARFSPNEDGRYDTFMPFDLKELSDKWELVIADLEGQEIYSSTSFDKPWKGNLPGGVMAPNSQMYFWTVICTDFLGNQRVYSDKVTVER
jgi:hypothetical protein